MEFCYTAVILKKRKIGETDRLYTLYTRENGKVQAIARGARKPRAKLAGHLETFNRGSVMVARSRGIGTITSAVADWYGGRLKRDGGSLLAAVQAVGTFERLVDVGERDMALFDLLTEYLETVDGLSDDADPRREEKLVLTTQAFLFQTLDRLGYRIETARSVATGEPLRAGGRYAFSVASGGIVEVWSPDPAEQIVPVGENAVKLLRLFLAQPIRGLSRVRADGRVLSETRRVLDRLVGWIG